MHPRPTFATVVYGCRVTDLLGNQEIGCSSTERDTCKHGQRDLILR